MTLSAQEQRVCKSIADRHTKLLDDLRLFVGIPTGGFHTPGIDETRQRFQTRLGSIGAEATLVPPGPKPNWLLGTDADSSAPVTAVCQRLPPGRPRVLIAGHRDTVHDPASDFRELTIASDGKTATGPGCVDMKGGLVIAVSALEALEECGLEASWSFLMNADEETGSYHSEGALREQAGARGARRRSPGDRDVAVRAAALRAEDDPRSRILCSRDVVRTRRHLRERSDSRLDGRRDAALILDRDDGWWGARRRGIL